MFSKFIAFSNSTFLTILNFLQFQNNVIDQDFIVNIKLLILKSNIKDFNENTYMKNIKNYKNMNLINYNNFKETKSDEYLNDVNYETKYKTHKNIKSDNNDLFIINLLYNY